MKSYKYFLLTLVLLQFTPGKKRSSPLEGIIHFTYPDTYLRLHSARMPALTRTYFLLILALFRFNGICAQSGDARIHEIEEYAIHAPDSVSKNLTSLVHYLMLPAQSDAEKARMIYAWIATHIRYDQSSVNAGKTADFAANLVLKKKKAVCLGISMLYEAMAVEAGLEVRTIIGYAKGSVAETKRLRNPNHAWNVVFFDGAWRLLDVTWGSGYSLGRGKNIKVKQSYDPVWFDADPRFFLFTHLPDIPKWQLVENPLDLNDFKKTAPFSGLHLQKGFAFDSLCLYSQTEPLQRIPVIYFTRESWRLLESPGPMALHRQKRYHFKMQSIGYEKLIVVNGKEEMKLAARDGVFDFDITAQGKDVSFYFFPKLKSKKGELGMVVPVVR